MKRTTIMSVAVLCLIGAVQGSIFYVSSGGSDSGDGSITNPFATVGVAYSAACSTGAQAVVQVLPGTYYESNVLTLAGVDVLIKGSGPEQTLLQADLYVSGYVPITNPAAGAALADIEIGGAVSNDACMLLSNAKLSGEVAGGGMLIGQWRDAADQVFVRGLGTPDDGRDAASMAWVTNYVAGNVLGLSGGVLSGYLTLAGNPTEDLHAVTKAYVDALTNGFNGLFLRKDGDTMSGGTLTLANVPSAPMHAATKLYVDETALSSVSNDMAQGAITFAQPPIVLGAITAATHAVNKQYVDRSLLYQHDAIIGVNYTSVKQAVDGGATNIFLPPGVYYEEWTSPVSVQRPLRIQGSGKGATKLTVRTLSFQQGAGVIINQLNNGYFEICDLTLNITNDCGNSMRGFFEIESPCMMRLSSIAGSCYSANNELWFIKTKDGALASISIVCEDIDYMIRTASRAGFMVLQQTRPMLYFRNSRLVIDKMGGGQGTDGSMILCGLKDSHDGQIYACNLTMVVTNHVADSEYMLQVVNEGNGALKSLFMDNCHIELNKNNPSSVGVAIRADAGYVGINNSYIQAATGVYFHLCNGGGYAISNITIGGVAFNTDCALDFSNVERPGAIATVGDCTFRGTVTNAGCKTLVVMDGDRHYNQLTASQLVLVSNLLTLFTGNYIVSNAPDEAAEGLFYLTGNMQNSCNVYTNVLGAVLGCSDMQDYGGFYVYQWTLTDPSEQTVDDRTSYGESIVTTPPADGWTYGSIVSGPCLAYELQPPQLDFGGGRLQHVSDGVADDDAATVAQVNSARQTVSAQIDAKVALSSNIADGAVTTDKIADGAVTTNKLAENVDTRYVNATGDAMTGLLTVPDICISNNWVVGSGNSKQVIAVVNESAGRVTWTEGAIKQVTHNLAIAGGEYIVLVTPSTSPDGPYAVTERTADSFTVSNAVPFNFDYMIIKN